MNIPFKKNLLFFILLSFTLLGLSHVYTQKNSSHSGIIYITEKEINDASSSSIHGYIINKPGTYILQNNVNWSTPKPDSFAITISANKVTLDGKDNVIKQTDPSIKHAIGIQVKEGYKNIHIQNLKCDALSGGGIWFRGDNANLTVKNGKFTNCGYSGMTQLDAKCIPSNVPRSFTQAIFFDGGYGKPIKDAQVIDCVFAECGILRASKTPQYESNSGAILGYQASNITIKGCTIDGCVGRDNSWAITLMSISNVLVSDVFITDIFSRGNAQGIYTYDVDGEIQDTPQTSIISHVHENQFGYMLDNHISYKESVPYDSNYRIEANHLKGIIPKHKEKEQALFDEHKWREFRTLGRLVCHNADKKSKTAAIYGKWVELFCDKVLDVKVNVVGGFANLYMNGNVPLPAHRDQYKKWIIGLSFGDTRTLDFVPDDLRAEIVSFPMEAGDVFIFSPDVNNRYQHRMLEEPERTGRRINVTYFLDVAPGQDVTKLLRPPELNKKPMPTFEEAEALYNQTEKKIEKKKVIVQDEKGNLYEEVNGKLIPLPANFL